METRHLLSELGQAPLWLSRVAAALKGRENHRREEEWSFSELLDHVIASDQILATRIMQVLVRPGVALPGFDERRWAEVAARSGRSLSERLDLFSNRRRELVALLGSLASREWHLSGEHEEAGVLTIHDIVLKLTEHEVEHRTQAEGFLRQVVEDGPTNP